MRTGSSCRSCIAVMVALGLIAVAGTAEAQSPPQATPPPGTEVAKPKSVHRVTLPIAPRGHQPDPTGLCQDKPGGLAWIDRMQAGLYRTMCLTASGFDGLFGNARFDDEYEATYGSLAVGTLWDQRDQLDPSVRFRVQLRLPQLDQRLSAFVGRVNPEEFVTERRDDFDTLPAQFGRADDDDLLFGLGYRQPGPGGGHFDAGIGARLGWPMEPYVKGAYRFTQPFLERNLLRLNESIFWRDGEGFGTTTRLDLERLLGERFLVRWTGSGTFTQETRDARWLSTLTLYQNLGDGHAFAYQAGIDGETDKAVGVVDYGLRVIYRRRIHLDWLFLELRSSVTWPRDTLLERRESNWGAGVAIEMQFGERETR